MAFSLSRARSFARHAARLAGGQGGDAFPFHALSTSAAAPRRKVGASTVRRGPNTAATTLSMSSSVRTAALQAAFTPAFCSSSGSSCSFASCFSTASTGAGGASQTTPAPGLFGLDGLTAPEDFRGLTMEAVKKCGLLVQRIVANDTRRREAAASNGGRPVPWSYSEALALLDDLDAISYTLCDVVDTAELTRQAHASDAFRRSGDDVYHGLSEVLSQLSSHAGLYWAIRSLTDDTAFFETEMEPEHRRMAIMLQREFERDGIHLPASEQQKVMELRNRITRLETQFVQVASGVGDPTGESGDSVGRGGTAPDSVLVPRRQIAGLPAYIRSQLHNGHESDTSDALVRIPVASDNGGDHAAEMVLSVCPSRDARKAVFVARNHQGRAQNATSLGVLQELLDARQDLAKVLGFDSYGDMQVREGDRMLGSRANVTAFLNAVRDRLRPEVEREAELMRREMGQTEPEESDTEDPVMLQQWDISYCSSKARKRLQEEQLQSLDASSSASSFASIESEAMEYFTVDGVINGLDLVCQNLFGLSLEQVPSEEWAGSAEDWVDSSTHAIGGARKIVCTHETEGPMGTVYMDLYPREGKYNHAAHFMSRCGHRVPGGSGGGSGSGEDDGFQLPSLGLLMNFTPPKSGGFGARLFGVGQPAHGGLMSHAEVETLFHEFGHALHSIFSRARYQHLSGTRTLMDFVEVPSHLMEHFVWDHRVLSRFALHHETGEPIPKSLVDRMLQQRSVFWGLETDTQLVYACLDHALHGSDMLQGDPRPSTTEMLHRVQKDCSLLPPHPDVALHSRFTHLTGYGAGYYSYLYAKIVAEHIWSRCFKESPLCRAAGDRYRQEVLRHGGAKDPNEILKDLLGDAPSMEALVATYFDGRKR